ncbi:MAG TPA: biopolymer transporter ExbD [Rhodothermales bacterium]|nr:biopolymer transporter ExbD [Rhodothermales bacterium]HRR07092.1 biopolymer transporter ExbD [Rhodothermales bacterium]
MADIEPSGGQEKGGKKRSKKMSTRIDFTPMVDLAFLLITFFMLTTTFAKPQAMEINMPEKEKPGDPDPPQVKASTVMTLLLGKDNKIVYYEGLPEEGANTKTEVTDFGANGIRKALIKKKQEVDAREDKKDKTLVLIKPSDASNYRNLVDSIDEMAITGIKRYAIIELQPVEKDLLKKAGY